MSTLELKSVRKLFGDWVAVDDVTVTAQDREFLVLLGPSGCGKTTIMRLIAGLETASSGEIWIGGRCVNGELPRERDIAMVFQSYALYPHMSVYENIEYPLRVRKIPTSARRSAVLDAALKVHLQDFLERRPGQLSGGQRQRVALARAIVRRPQVFLMDEPLSNLDAMLRVKMRSELKHLHYDLGITTVYVTHDQSEALTLADRIAVMKEGRIIQLSDPQTLYDRPTNMFVAEFVGSLAMNFVQGELSQGAFLGKGIRVPGISGETRTSVALGVRPSDLEVVPASSANFAGELYSLEKTGEGSIATVRLNDSLISVVIGRDYAPPIGETVPLGVKCGKAHLFDLRTGERLPSTAELNVIVRTGDTA